MKKCWATFVFIIVFAIVQSYGLDHKDEDGILRFDTLFNETQLPKGKCSEHPKIFVVRPWKSGLGAELITLSTAYLIGMEENRLVVFDTRGWGWNPASSAGDAELGISEYVINPSPCNALNVFSDNSEIALKMLDAAIKQAASVRRTQEQRVWVENSPHGEYFKSYMGDTPFFYFKPSIFNDMSHLWIRTQLTRLTLTPQQKYQKMLDQISWPKSPVLGVHLRVGPDKVYGHESIENRVDHFAILLGQVLQLHNNIKNVFLVSDLAIDIEMFRKMHPSINFFKRDPLLYNIRMSDGHVVPTARILQIPQSKEQENLKDQIRRDAYLDFLCMRKTDYFIGTYTSAWGRLIAFMFNAESKFPHERVFYVDNICWTDIYPTHEIKGKQYSPDLFKCRLEQSWKLQSGIVPQNKNCLGDPNCLVEIILI